MVGFIKGALCGKLELRSTPVIMGPLVREVQQPYQASLEIHSLVDSMRFYHSMIYQR